MGLQPYSTEQQGGILMSNNSNSNNSDDSRIPILTDVVETGANTAIDVAETVIDAGMNILTLGLWSASGSSNDSNNDKSK